MPTGVSKKTIKCAECGFEFERTNARQKHCSQWCRFDAKVRVDDFSGCWLWQGYKDVCGYGRFRTDAGCVLAHRWIWQHRIGEIPEGSHVLHRCDVRNCVNPKHLFLGSNADNVADRVSKGRSARGETIARHKRGERNPNCRFTSVVVKEMRSLYRGGWTQEQIARKFGTTQHNVSRIVNRKRRKDG